LLSLLCRLGLRDAALLFPGKPEAAQLEGDNAEHMEKDDNFVTQEQADKHAGGIGRKGRLEGLSAAPGD